MNRKQTITLINNLHISQLSLNEVYKWYDIDKIDGIINPMFDSFKLLVWKELWDRITRWVYEVPDMLERNWYVECSSQGVKYELENIDDFLNFLLIVWYIVE